MKITPEMIDAELRDVAEVFMDNPTETEEAFRLGMEAGLAIVDSTIPDTLRMDEVQIVGSSGQSIRTLILRSKETAQEKLPGILWIHGGAFATGAPESSMNVLERLIMNGPAVIVSPDYRLALTDPFPAGVSDCYDVLLWMRDHATELGIRTDQLIVGGDSSGANFAVSLALRARDTGDVKIAFQMPIFPCLDDTMESESIKENNAPLVDNTLIYYAWKVYLGDNFATDHVSKYAAPARESNYENLPPLICYVGGIDPLRDDAVAYAGHLEAAGIPVQFRVFPGCFHGFEEFCPDATVSKNAIQFFVESYQYALKNYFAAQS